jgi:hypothetical protein
LTSKKLSRRIAPFAAFADGHKADTEREEIPAASPSPWLLTLARRTRPSVPGRAAHA